MLEVRSGSRDEAKSSLAAACVTVEELRLLRLLFSLGLPDLRQRQSREHEVSCTYQWLHQTAGAWNGRNRILIFVRDKRVFQDPSIL